LSSVSARGPGAGGASVCILVSSNLSYQRGRPVKRRE
jgi:hypothetical protein